ncbi:MAG TPA: hypothetical protein DEP42_02395 [Ruminococcaceae bacterium]|nr:hypothetical protein [Oscillospiraceae bacterium]
MLYVTGDVHADLRDFDERAFRKVKKTDYIVICGDFGMIWNGDANEKKALTRLGKSHYPILFLDGAHENFDLLSAYPVTEWHGGKAQIIDGNLIHLMRGQVYQIDDKKIFTFGGGESKDRELREAGVSWWPQEMPNEEEMREGIEHLVENDWTVDYIFTYEAPSGMRQMLVNDDWQEELNPFQVYLDHIREKCSFARWIFGNYHCNRRLSANTDVVFDDVIPLISGVSKLNRK